jgi:hypothetical protein
MPDLIHLVVKSIKTGIYFRQVLGILSFCDWGFVNLITIE